MKVSELIEKLKQWPDQNAEVTCSINCDPKDADEDGKRVFGKDLWLVNGHVQEAVLLFDLESINFEVEEGEAWRGE